MSEKTYKHPPVVERIAILLAEMEEDQFISRQQSWEDKVMEEFPNNESISRWEMIATEEEDGLPVWSSIRPKLKIIPRFSKLAKADGFDWSIRFPAGHFAMNMHSDPTQEGARGFGDLRSSFEDWISRWINHFEVEAVTNLGLLYCNALTPRTVPDFFEDGGLRLGDIVRPFADIPGNFHSIVPPYSCEVNLQVDEEATCKLAIKVDDYKSKVHGTGIGIKFEANMGVAPEHPVSLPEIMGLLDTCHGHIIAQFEAIFTEEAKKSFERV